MTSERETGGATLRLRQDIANLPSYKAGKPAPADAYKVSSNENPYSPLPSVVAAMGSALATINRYPDPACSELRARVAAELDVPANALVFSTGSVSVLQHLVNTVAGPGDEVIFAWRSFEAYPIIVGVAGAKPVMVPLLDDQSHDLDAMAAAITDATRMILICSPNNPTGTVVTQAQFDAFMAKVPEDLLVVLDEAYLEFVAATDAVDGPVVYAKYSNVALLRTFSKAYGLAGLRVGFAVVPPSFVEQVGKAVTPFGVSMVAQTAALACFEPEARRELKMRVSMLQAERARVMYALTDQGWPLPQSEGNFIYLVLGSKSADFAEHCERGGLVVRAYAEDGVRITIDHPEVNDRTISLCKEWRAFSKAARLI